MANSNTNQEKGIGFILNEATDYVFKDHLENLKESSSQTFEQIWSGPLSSRIEKLIHWILIEEEKTVSFGQDWSSNGRLGPNYVYFHKSNYIGIFSFHDDPLHIRSIHKLSTALANTCVFHGKWQYEVLLCTKGVMQIGWATDKCTFTAEYGVGDTPDSYAYDGSRQSRWNVASHSYGEMWSAGDIISCTIDLTEGKLSYFRNGRNLGTAYDDVKCGAEIAYFPALSLASDESLFVNFGNTPFCYPQPGYLPMISPQTTDALGAKIHLGFMKKLIDLTSIYRKGCPNDVTFKCSNASAAIQIVAQHIGEKLATYLCQLYIVNEVFLPFLQDLVHFQPNVFTPVQNTEKAHIMFDFLFSMLQEFEMLTFTQSLINSLESWHRRTPQDCKFSYQIYSLQMLYVILSHQKMRKLCLVDVIFRKNKFVYFMTVECVDSFAMKKLNINFCSDKTGEYKFGCEDSYRSTLTSLREPFNELAALQVTILELMLTVDDEDISKSSRVIFLKQLRLLLFTEKEFLNSRAYPEAPIASVKLMNLCERLFEVLRHLWKSEIGSDLIEGSISPRMFYDGSVEYFDISRLGGLDSHLRKKFASEIQHALRNEARSDPLIIGGSNTSPAACSSDEPSTSAIRESSSCSWKSQKLKVERRRSLEHLFDSIVMLYLFSHNVIGKIAKQTELMFENIDHYKHLVEKRENFSEDSSSSVISEINDSISVLAMKLKEQMCQHMWNEVRFLNGDYFKKMLEMLTLTIGLVQSSSGEGPLFAFVPAFYIEAIGDLFYNLKLLVVNLDSEGDDMKLSFLMGVHMEDKYKKDYLKFLHLVGEFLIRHFCDTRIAYADSKHYLIQTMAFFIKYKPGLRAVEHMKEGSRKELITHLLQPYVKTNWPQRNWILVQFWKGNGFGFRFTQSPHLSVKFGPTPTHSDTSRSGHITVPCPSDVFLGHVSQYLQNDNEDSTKFVNFLLNQLNWSFSEFISVLQEIHNTSYSSERSLIDTRRLSRCASYFDLSLALLRALEMVVHMASQLFLDSSSENSKSLLCRVCQLMCLVLNRTSFSSGGFGYVVKRDIAGLDGVHYYPILTAVAGILLSLLKKDVQNNTNYHNSATETLLSDSNFQLSSLCAILGFQKLKNALQLFSISDTKYSINPELQEELNNASFSLLHYPNHVSREEVQALVDTINHLRAKSLASVNQEKMDSDQFCTICYANLPNAVFYPCNHFSCVSCICHYLMDHSSDCFFCKIKIEQVVNQDTGLCIYEKSTR